MLKTARLSDFQLAVCSKWSAPDGAVFLELPHFIVFTMKAETTAPYFGVEQAVNGEYPFELRAIGASVPAPLMTIRFQWPNGRYFSPTGIDPFAFLGTGKRGRGLAQPVLMQPGEKILMDVDNTAGAAANTFYIFFEGVVRVPLIRGTR